MNYHPVVIGNQPNDNLADDVANAAFDVKENENDVHVSTNGSDKTDNKKHDEKAKRDTKGKSHVDSPTVVRDLRAEFEEFSFNSTNRVNAVSAPVNAVEPNSTNNSNCFNTASPSVNVVSPNFGIDLKSSFVDPSKYPDDPDMPELEDIVYSDDEEDVGAEADLSNLETNIPISPIPTTKVHKDNPINQIISKVNLAPHTKSMTKMVKEQGGQSTLWVASTPKAWYETLANNLLESGFQRGKIDQALFIKKQKGDILLVQVYVDDIIFGSTDKELCKAFEKLMKDKFQMISMGELTFFLVLLVKQKDDGIFISQDKYVAKILKKFGFTDVKSASIPIETKKPLPKEPDGEDVDVHVYRCLKGKPHLGSWYPRDYPFNLVAYYDSDYAVASLDRKSIIGGCQFLGCRLISWQCKKQNVVATSLTEAQQYISNESPLLRVNTPRCDEDSIELMELMVFMYALVVNPTIYVACIKQFWATATIKKINDVVQLRALIDGKKVVVFEDIIQRDIHLDDADGVKCLPNEEIFEELAMLRGLHGMSSAVPWNLLSSALLQRVGKGFSRVETPLFALMLVQPQVQAEEEEKDDEMPISLSPSLQDPTPIPHATPHASPPQEQPTSPNEFIMPLLTTLMETCTSLSQKVARGCIQIGGKIEAIDADEDITLVDVETQEEVVAMDVESQGRINQEVNAASKEVSVTEPTVFEDEEYDDKEEDIDWNVVAEQIQERHLDNIKKYQSLKKKPVSIAEARKNIIIYLKNMAGYKIKHFRGMNYDKVRPIFEREYKKVHTLFKRDKEVEKPKKKEFLMRHCFKKLKAVEVLGSESTQEIPSNDTKEMYEEDV
nr:hypothetical protein [Tanacetum cinerariifolium]